MTSEPSNFISKLSDDLLLEIFHLLPSDSAFRCKSVCKHWLSLTSNPTAAHHHHHQHNSLNFLLIYNQKDQSSDFPEDLRPSSIHHLKIPNSSPQQRLLRFDVQKLFPVACSDDLIVFRKTTDDDDDNNIRKPSPSPSPSPSPEENKNPDSYYLCNPLIRQWIKLPQPTTFNELHYLDRGRIIYSAGDEVVGLVCYPKCSCSAAADINTSYSYKILRVSKLSRYVRIHPGRVIDLAIFCSESNQWFYYSKPSSSAFRIADDTTKMVTYNGILHWISYSALGQKQNIIAYNPLDDIERYRVIAPPNDLNRAIAPPNNIPHSLSTEQIGVSGGKLKICQVIYKAPYHESRGKGVSLNVWELEDYYNNEGRWLSEHRIRFVDMKLKGDWIPGNKKGYRVKMMGFHPLDGDIVYLNYHHKLASYNMRTGELSLVCFLHINIMSFDSKMLANLFPLLQRWRPTPVPPLLRTA